MKSELRLLIHTPFFHPLVGGVETFTDGLATELARRGVAVRVIAETPLAGATALDRAYPVTRPPYDRSALLATADVLLAVGPSTKLLGAARRAGLPFVLRHAAPAGACPIGIGWRNERPCDYNPLKCLGCRVSQQTVASNVRSIARFHRLRWGMKRAAENIYISASLARRTPWCPGVVILNFADSAVFLPNPECAPEPVFLFVGRLVPIKGADVAIRGFAEARRRGLSHRLAIVGDGPARPMLEQLVATEGVADSVEFLGTCQGSGLARLYHSAYALLFPSQWEEPFGIVMAEALGCGCPVIASGHGSCPEVIGDAGVLATPPADPSVWAEAMLRLARDPARRTELAAVAVSRAKKLFSLAAVADRYLEVLTRAVENHQGRGGSRMR